MCICSYLINPPKFKQTITEIYMSKTISKQQRQKFDKGKSDDLSNVNAKHYQIKQDIFENTDLICFE